MSVLYRVVNVLCSAFAVYLIVYATFLFLSVIIGANTMYARRRRGYYENRLDVKSFIPISIIVPAYNMKNIDTKKYKIELHPVRKVEGALRTLFG